MAGKLWEQILQETIIFAMTFRVPKVYIVHLRVLDHED